MFDDLGELERVFGMLDEASVYPPEVSLEWTPAENSEFEKTCCKVGDGIDEDLTCQLIQTMSCGWKSRR